MAYSPLEMSRHYETVPRLCPTETRKRRNLPPLPIGTEAQTMQVIATTKNDYNNNTAINPNKKCLDDMNDYIVAEKIQVPLTNNSLLKPILKTLGRVQMQIWNNCKEAKLALTINQASNLQVHMERDSPTNPQSTNSTSTTNPNSVTSSSPVTVTTTTTATTTTSTTSFILVVGRVMFEEQATKTFRTNPVPTSSKPVWNETFLFEYNESVEDATLEICAHETKSPNDLRLLRDTFLGMIILPLSEANLEDEPRWYELRVSILHLELIIFLILSNLK